MANENLLVCVCVCVYACMHACVDTCTCAHVCVKILAEYMDAKRKFTSVNLAFQGSGGVQCMKIAS